jgi:hypothetical protein
MAIKLAAWGIAAALAFTAAAASAGTLSVDLRPATDNPAAPQMGDRLLFRSVLRNQGSAPVNGAIVWISLIRIDLGNEQPVDLEDWSAQKAVTAPSLPVGGTIRAEWPMRLIQAGTYRLMVAAGSRDGGTMAFGPFAEFTVREKAVVESGRVLPVALGFPLLIAGAMLWRWRQGRANPPLAGGRKPIEWRRAAEEENGPAGEDTAHRG